MSTKKNQTNTENELLKIVLHDIQSPLRFIGTIMQELTLHCKDIDKNVLQNHVMMVNESVLALQNYCKQISNWERLKNMELNTKSHVNINELFSHIKALYLPLIKSKKIIFEVIISNIFYFIEKEILLTILLNIIDNAYKNTDAGLITLKAIKEEEIIKIIITDTGKGMLKKTIKNILNSKNQLKQSSLGYYIITDLLKKINGEINIESKINVGTTVIISLSNPEKYDNAYQGSSVQIS